MKILLFNLGTIEHRILIWDVEGFRSLLEQDIILWGPIPDESFVYRGKEIPILSFFEPTTIQSVFNRLPEGWYPDIVACDTSVISYVPDIYLCPVKTILFTRDSWSDTLFNRGLVELFDCVTTAAIDRPLFNNFHVHLLPLSGFAVSKPGPGSQLHSYDDRDIDVIAIANYDNSFYHDRYKTFFTLARANSNKFKIRYLKHIERSEIYDYYQRSKIVLDWAHTLSNRSYEAALNGCLLFSHEDNTLNNDFWTPWEEYIPYNNNNLSELIAYYIHNPDKAKEIINATKQKIIAITASWGEMAWEKIQLAFKTNVSIEGRIAYNLSVPASILHYRSSTPLLYNYDYSTKFPSNWDEIYFERIDRAISAAGNDDLKIGPLTEASHLAFLLKKTEFAVTYLDSLHKIIPDYAWIYYLYGRIYFDRRETDKALVSVQKAILSGHKAPELLQKFVLPIIEKGNPCHGRRITDYMWQSAYNHNNEFQVKALLHLSHELAGDIYRRNNENKEAIASYIEAIGYLPIPKCIYKIYPLLIQAGEYIMLYDVTSKGLKDSPYDNILIFCHTYALIKLKRRREAYVVLTKHRRALHSFTEIRLFRYIRWFIYFLLPLVLVGKQPASLLISEFIKILMKKSKAA